MDNKLFCHKSGSSSTDAVSPFRSVSVLLNRRNLLLDWTLSDDMGFWYCCIVIVSVLDFLQKVDFDQLYFVTISFGLSVRSLDATRC